MEASNPNNNRNDLTPETNKKRTAAENSVIAECRTMDVVASSDDIIRSIEIDKDLTLKGKRMRKRLLKIALYYIGVVLWWIAALLPLKAQ